MKKERANRKASARLNPSKGKAVKHDDFLTDLASLPRIGQMDEAKESPGGRIRRIREERGLSIKDLSSRTGIDITALVRIESGKTIPALGQLVRLGRALDMKMGYLISPGIDKPMTVVHKDERRPVSRYGETKSMLCGYSYESLAPEKAGVGDRTDFLKPGDAAYYDSVEPHFVRCVGTSPAQILAVLYTGS